MQSQLILRFRNGSIESPQSIATLEQDLAQLLGASAQVDGHEIGSGSTDVYLLSDNPTSTFRRAKPLLEQLELLDRVVAAHRVVGGARFAVIWPLRWGRKFTVA